MCDVSALQYILLGMIRNNMCMERAVSDMVEFSCSVNGNSMGLV